ncbi:putative glycolipid-binding domain-containing protein [Actinomadura parmotrematis]|uniref:Glycolipid-binding domain-containing protein n=1 Tax=Actinomadura parmotrematis TaxID=2864039 RepID=A0ABS7FSU4_9ACTN|nr:putative glycolipid-binding domain-containing protein [Actinomadura parmotrematis]MBW8483485.1 putative glycolipid-binding domain-containing protein [Actinomadura parmotrematis]
MTRSLVWVKERGAELAEVTLSEGRLAAAGSAIGGGDVPYLLEYELTTGDRYITARLLVRTHGEDEAAGPWRRSLELVGRPEGRWTVNARAEGRLALPPPGGDAAALDGALDCDLALSPLASTLPVLREGLLGGGGPVDVAVARVSVPDLRVAPETHTYAFARRDGARAVLRHDDPRGGREIVFDADGLVADHPAAGRRV